MTGYISPAKKGISRLIETDEFKLIFAIILVIQVFDGATTIYGIEKCNFIEKNPETTTLHERYGLLMGQTVKTIFDIIFGFLMLLGLVLIFDIQTIRKFLNNGRYLIYGLWIFYYIWGIRFNFLVFFSC
ncbi:MAG: hypothetical protein ACE5PM_03055 [Candidatus Hydrothermarchaeales archaeon]